MAKEKISDEHKRYGELITRFASAQNTDDAILTFLENMQKCFHFSPQFMEQIKSDYVTLEEIHARYTDDQMKLLELIGEERILTSDLDQMFQGCGCVFRDYNVDNKSLIIGKLIFYGGQSFSKEPEVDISEETYEFSVDEFENMFDVLDIPKPKPILIYELLRYTHELIRVGLDIYEVKETLTEKQIEKVYDLSDYYYENLLAEHDHIAFLQEQLRLCLEQIIENVPKKNGFNMFHLFLRIYNEMKKPPVFITDDGEIKEDSWFREKYYVDRAHSINGRDKETLVEYYSEPISYCLIEFLRKQLNVRYLRNCNYCKNFYIAKVIRKDQKYCSICSPKNKMTKEERADYMREVYRPMKKKIIGKKRRKALIQKYMDSGMTRREAELRIDDSL